MSTSFLFLLSACASSGDQPTVVSVDEQKDNTTVELQVGDRLEISLPGNPTTGYECMLNRLDKAILETVGEPEYSLSGNALGAGGRYIFRMKALAAGEIQVELVYRRSFESKDVPSADEYNISVKVK